MGFAVAAALRFSRGECVSQMDTSPFAIRYSPEPAGSPPRSDPRDAGVSGDLLAPCFRSRPTCGEVHLGLGIGIGGSSRIPAPSSPILRPRGISVLSFRTGRTQSLTPIPNPYLRRAFELVFLLKAITYKMHLLNLFGYGSKKPPDRRWKHYPSASRVLDRFSHKARFCWAGGVKMRG